MFSYKQLNIKSVDIMRLFANRYTPCISRLFLNPPVPIKKLFQTQKNTQAHIHRNTQKKAHQTHISISSPDIQNKQHLQTQSPPNNPAPTRHKTIHNPTRANTPTNNKKSGRTPTFFPKQKHQQTYLTLCNLFDFFNFV